MTPDPYKALSEQSDRLKQHDTERRQLLSQRNTLIRQLRADGHPLVRIAKAAGMSRESIYQITKGEP